MRYMPDVKATRMCADISPSQFKLIGQPWYSHSSDAVSTPMLLLQLMDVLVAFGWELHTTLDLTRSQAGRDMDTWFLRKCNV